LVCSLSVLNSPGLPSSGSRLSWSSLFRFQTLLVFLGSRRSWFVYGGFRLASTFFSGSRHSKIWPKYCVPKWGFEPRPPEYMG
jgi:hypothetical protein